MTGGVRSRTNRFERRRGLLLAGLAVGIAFATDLSSTLTLQLVGHNQYTQKHPVEKTYRMGSLVYHHDLRPNASVPAAAWGPRRYPVRTNSLGFKDASNRVVPLRSARPRLLFIGDSFTEGIGVPYEQTWVGLVDRQLAGRGVEVLNAGVCTYAPSIYYAKTRYLVEKMGLRFDELVVYLDISDAQDEVLSYRLDERERVVDRPTAAPMPHFTRRYFARTHPLERFVADNTSVGRFVLLGAEAGRWPAPRGVLDPVVDLYRGAWTFDRDAFEGFGRAGLAAMTDHMDRLAALAKQHRFRLTVGVYPWPGQIMYDVPESKQVRHWRDWAARHDAGFVDHFPDFLNADERARNVEEYFMPGDFHWNEAGHRRIAAGFLAAWEAAHPNGGRPDQAQVGTGGRRWGRG